MSVELCGLDLRQPLRTDCFVCLNLSWVDWRIIFAHSPHADHFLRRTYLLRCQVNRSQTGLEIGNKTPSSMAIGEMNDNPISKSNLNVFHGTKVLPHFQTQLDRSFSEDQGLGGSRHCNNRNVVWWHAATPKKPKSELNNFSWTCHWPSSFNRTVPFYLFDSFWGLVSIHISWGPASKAGRSPPGRLRSGIGWFHQANCDPPWGHDGTWTNQN